MTKPLLTPKFEKNKTMKKSITTLTFLFTLVYVGIAQDILTKKTGDDLQVKILEVGQSEIRYKMFNNLEGPIFSISKGEILMVRYENGTKDVFGSSTAGSQNDEQFQQGQLDAEKYYKNYKGASRGTLATTILTTPVLGLIPAFLTTMDEPEDGNLDYPNPQLMKDQEYKRGYIQKAKKIKSKKVWKNFGIGTGIFVAVIVLANTTNY